MNSIYVGSHAHNFLGVSCDTIFTVLVTVAIFVLGYIFNRIYDNAKRRRELEAIKVFLVTYLKSLLDPIQKQIDAFSSLSADVLSKKHQDFAFGDALGGKLYVLDRMQQVDMFAAFLLGPKDEKRERIAQFNRMLDALGFAKGQRDTAKAQFGGFMASHTRYVDQWNKAVNAVMRYEEKLVASAMRAGDLPDQDPFARGFNKLVQELSGVENRQAMDIVRELLLEPLRQLCKQHPLDPRVHEVIVHVIDALEALRNRNHLLSIFGKYFEDQAAELRGKKNALVDSIGFLEAAR